MTTRRDYYEADEQVVAELIRTHLDDATMKSQISANWRGWRTIDQDLDLGSRGGVNAPACGAFWDLQLKREPDLVADRDAPVWRRYTLLVYLRSQADPAWPRLKIHAFDQLLKNRLEAQFDGNPRREICATVPWTIAELSEEHRETLHTMQLALGD